MDSSNFKTFDFQPLQEAFGERVQTGVLLARYTAARVGGPADALLEVLSQNELVQAAELLWQAGLPFVVIGGGSNLLVSDAGVREVVLLNRSRQVRFDEQADPPTVWAESGANFGLVARQASQRGLGGLEWAAGIPGTVGGAVVGNAGAHGGDVAGCLRLAEILHLERGAQEKPARRESWPVERLGYVYRGSRLKIERRGSEPGQAGGSERNIVLSARLSLERSTPEATQAKLDQFLAQRRRTQPPGASMGSMFKNPPGDYAGRLIEAAGLKGARVGDAEINTLHANFFINRGLASAEDILRLIQTARQAVADQFGVKLELEIELLGDWHGRE